ncbi:RNA polymerase sigma factor [Silvanigrella aquatica]|uniref:RNA polymerase sigma factor 70 region 4 type 2 domain-containing protein n=1 Tax=Silvanigrella aquatica TaxID=1915309 RepID=A0A1L4CXQ7_9BACT|nr:sigma-70 family RNA polymerase sigma factor [Silvanigrella aquatica]APJ02729.1 hypothetical protein AXG55_01825 [Silvanigrella aquatica]
MQNKLIYNFNSIEFIEKLRKKEHQAFNSLVNEYTEQIYRAALGLGFNQNDSKELTQIVWTTLYEVLPEFKGKSHIRTFIFGIFYNKACELRREQKKYQGTAIDEIINEQFDDNGKWTKPPIDPETFLLRAENKEFIEKCVNSLPKNLKMAFSLKEIEEKKNSEICKILNVSYTNLGVLICRAKNKLREIIGKKLKRDWKKFPKKNCCLPRKKELNCK